MQVVLILSHDCQIGSSSEIMEFRTHTASLEIFVRQRIKLVLCSLNHYTKWVLTLLNPHHDF